MNARIPLKCVAILVVLHLSFAHRGEAQSKGQATDGSLPAAASVKSAADASALVRRLYFIAEYNDGAALGDSLARRFPRDTRLRAWYVANVGAAGRTSLADSLTSRTDTASRDPWELATRAFARRYSPMSSKTAIAEAVRLAQRARALAPRDPDLAWLVASATASSAGFAGNTAATIAFVDSVAPRVGNPIQLQLLRASALFQAGSRSPFATDGPPPDTMKRLEALRIYAALRAADSSNYAALYDAAARIRMTDEPQALALMKQAIALAPRAPYARSAYWALINGQRGPTASEKQAAIASDRAAFLAVTDSAPWALETAVTTMRYTTREPVAALEERILARAPRSTWAENVLLSRASQWGDSLYAARDTTRPGPKSDTLVVRRKFLDAMEAFIDKPWVGNPAVRDQATTRLFFEVREDSTYPADKLVALVKRVVAATSTLHPSVRYGQTARALADRKLDFRLAEQLAREGTKQVARYVGDFPGYVFTSVGDQADVVDAGQASIYADLGWSFFREGRLDEADKELSHALELTKKNVGIYYDLGRLRSAQGRDEEAELVFAQGMTVRVRGVNPNRKELARLYEKRHGSIDGWEAYITSLEEKERTTRRAKILATRAKEPMIVPSFSLPDLSGKVVKSDSVRSQYVVVNFWGMWCGPCVAEMPELQQFYDKYRNDKSVAIFTISNDKDLNELRDWMAKRKLTVPTLFDDGYVAKLAQIHAFPTTWFIDRDGKVQFSAVGNTGSLVEEWSWRLEATKTGAVIQP